MKGWNGGMLHSRYLLFVVFALNATLMLQAIPLPVPIPDGDYITYIGPIQLINTGASTDTEQVLRIVGSVQSAIENMVGNKPEVNLEISLESKKSETSSIEPMVSEPPVAPLEGTTTATLVGTSAAEIESTVTATPTEPPQEEMIDTETLMPGETTSSVKTKEEDSSFVPATENAKKHVVTVVEMSNQTVIYVYDPLTVQPGMEPWRALYESSGATILRSSQQESSTSAAEIVTGVTVQTEPITVMESTEANIVAASVRDNDVKTQKPEEPEAGMVNWLIKCLQSYDSSKTAGTVTNEHESKSSSWSSSWSYLNPARSITVSHEIPARSTNERFGSRKPSSTFTSWSSLNPNWSPKFRPIQEKQEFEPRIFFKENNSKPHKPIGTKQGNTGWNYWKEQPSVRTRTEQRFINEPFVHFGSRNSGRKSRQSA